MLELSEENLKKEKSLLRIATGSLFTWLCRNTVRMNRTIVSLIISKGVRWAEHEARMKEMRSTYIIFIRKYKGTDQCKAKLIVL
jgi:hypothetical protein